MRGIDFHFLSNCAVVAEHVGRSRLSVSVVSPREQRMKAACQDQVHNRLGRRATQLWQCNDTGASENTSRGRRRWHTQK